MKEQESDQVFYLGRWCDRASFRTCIFCKKTHEAKLAESYDEYESLIASGLWLAEKPLIDISKARKLTDGTNS